MTPHDQWDTMAFDLDGVAAHTGPFTRRDFLRAWWEYRDRLPVVRLLDTGSGLVPLCEWQDAVRFLGEADLTDYHSPLGSGTAESLADYVTGLTDGTRIHLDSLPLEAALAIEAGLEAAGITATAEQHQVAAVLELPDDHEGWLANLDRKERQEVRRKTRRFEAAGGRLGPVRESGPAAVEMFAAMHRLAPGPKGTFMSAAIEDFFGALHRDAGGVVDVLYGPGGTPVASAFGFEDEDAYYLYNSAFVPEAGSLSPGIVLLAGLVARAIRSGKQFFDFLKGDDMYKYRHGARPRPLFEISLTKGTKR